ncbi:reverse transcriptase domain-containing protein [Tanacetum coccineum]
MPTTRQGLSSTAIEQLIAERVADAMIAYEANKNSGTWINNDESGSAGGLERTTHGCSYKEFMNYNFNETKGAVESCQVKFVTCTILDGALTCWNSYVHFVGLDVAYETTWKEVKEMMIKEYFPRNEGNVTSSNPTKIQEAIHMAYDLMDQVVQAKAAKGVDNKRKWDENHRNNSGQQNKRQEVVRAYNVGPNDRNVYARKAPLYNRCKLHHIGPCNVKCNNCQRISHQTRDCKTSTPTTIQRPLVTSQRTSATCFKCGVQGHYKSECSKLKNHIRGNQNGSGGARGRAFVL